MSIVEIVKWVGVILICLLILYLSVRLIVAAATRSYYETRKRFFDEFLRRRTNVKRQN